MSLVREKIKQMRRDSFDPFEEVRRCAPDRVFLLGALKWKQGKETVITVAGDITCRLTTANHNRIWSLLNHSCKIQKVTVCRIVKEINHG